MLLPATCIAAWLATMADLPICNAPLRLMVISGVLVSGVGARPAVLPRS
ncbi:MAG: hypothetical protein ACYTBR_15460 [Planctomycetota bacterium]